MKGCCTFVLPRYVSDGIPKTVKIYGNEKHVSDDRYRPEFLPAKRADFESPGASARGPGHRYRKRPASGASTQKNLVLHFGSIQDDIGRFIVPRRICLPTPKLLVDKSLRTKDRWAMSSLKSLRNRRLACGCARGLTAVWAAPLPRWSFVSRGHVVSRTAALLNIRRYCP